MSDQQNDQHDDLNADNERNARGDTPTQAGADGAPDPNQREESVGVDVTERNPRRGAGSPSALAENTGRTRRGDAREYTLYHPHGFAVPVVGKSRRDELLSRGYTEEPRGDIRETGVTQQGLEPAQRDRTR